MDSRRLQELRDVYARLSHQSTGVTADAVAISAAARLSHQSTGVTGGTVAAAAAAAASNAARVSQQSQALTEDTAAASSAVDSGLDNGTAEAAAAVKNEKQPESQEVAGTCVDSSLTSIHTTSVGEWKDITVLTKWLYTATVVTDYLIVLYLL